jgi:hypothetical protein
MGNGVCSNLAGNTVHWHFGLGVCPGFERAQGHFLGLSYRFVLAGLNLPVARFGIAGSK